MNQLANAAFGFLDNPFRRKIIVEFFLKIPQGQGHFHGILDKTPVFFEISDAGFQIVGIGHHVFLIVSEPRRQCRALIFHR